MSFQIQIFGQPRAEANELEDLLEKTLRLIGQVQQPSPEPSDSYDRRKQDKASFANHEEIRHNAEVIYEKLTGVPIYCEKLNEQVRVNTLWLEALGAERTDFSTGLSDKDIQDFAKRLLEDARVDALTAFGKQKLKDRIKAKGTKR